MCCVADFIIFHGACFVYSRIERELYGRVLAEL